MNEHFRKETVPRRIAIKIQLKRKRRGTRVVAVQPLKVPSRGKGGPATKNDIMRWCEGKDTEACLLE